jgi:hypothetical protein
MKKSFEDWMKEVDTLVSNALGGLTTADLIDQRYEDWYDAGTSPKTAAKRAIKKGV